MLVGCWNCGQSYDNARDAWNCPHDNIFPPNMIGFGEPPKVDEEDDEDTSRYVGSVDYDVPESDDE